MRLDFFLDYGPAEDTNIKQVAEEASETDDKTDEKQMMTRHMQPLLNPFPCTPNDPHKHKHKHKHDKRNKIIHFV